MENITPPIRAAALRLPDGSTISGHSHWEAYENAVRAGTLPATDAPDFALRMDGVIDGFVDGCGAFLHSAEAAKRALAHQQTDRAVQNLQSESIFEDDPYYFALDGSEQIP